VSEAAKRAPALVKTSDELLERSRRKWQSSDMAESIAAARIGEIKLRHALVLFDQDAAKMRIAKAEDDLDSVREEQDAALKELDHANEKVHLLKLVREQKGLPATNGQPTAQPTVGTAAVASLPGPAPAASLVSPDATAMPRVTVGVPQRSSYALIIAIERYRDLPAAPGARIDAEHYQAVVARTLGIPQAHIRVAVDDHATKADIERSLEWIEKNVTAGSRVYFFYSGHGAPDPSSGTPYLVPYDADAKAIQDSALPLANVLGSLEHSKAKEVLAFVDSCFSGQGGRSVLPPGIRPLVMAKAAPKSNKLVLFSAASGNEISGPAPGNQGGLFSYYVFQALGQGAADMDADGQITAGELQKWLKPRVARAAKQDGRDQNPEVQAGKNVPPLDELPVLWGLGER
jgi:hypothetical protein